MIEFLVQLSVEIPETVGLAELEALKSAERVRAGELAKNGVLKRLWRIPGRWANWGLWQAQSEVDLRKQLASLPLWPYMTASITALEAHPNDPRFDARDFA